MLESTFTQPYKAYPHRSDEQYTTHKLPDPAPAACGKGVQSGCFDIFDTLLKRDCAHPADLFALMEVTHQAALGFAGTRVAAEAETRQTLGREVTLAEIYAHPALRGTEPAAECAAAELAMIAPNRPVAQAAAACHARGQKVYAVSDMYLPKEQIEAMLQKCGLDFLDGVFVSCEYGVQKRSGKLFKLFLQQTALRPAEVLFVEDSPRADFAGQRWRVSAALLPQPTPLPYTQNPDGCRRWCRNCHLTKTAARI